jgi:protein-tyrosine phosphatase
MDEIFKVHKNLYIGAYWPQINFEKLKKTGITAIVNLMEMNHYSPPEDFIYLYKGFPDNTYPPHHYLKEILNFIDENLKEGKVLVHCAMGISRSGGLIVAWLLKEHPQWSWSDAINYVWKVRRILPAIEIRESILDYLESIEGYRRLL